ncbi:MAG: hypothetical protein ABI591_31335 [Kofleriaceae bacterium]
MRIVPGLQRSGRLHLGDYFGAMPQQLALHDQGELLLFIADLHALPTLRAPSRLAAFTRDIALDYLAIDLDPANATLFRQNDAHRARAISQATMARGRDAIGL